MAKQPETVDRFRITCEVPKQQLGDVIAEFTKMGLQHVHHELITDVISYKKSKQFDTNGADHLRAWIKDHPTFTRQDVIAHFEATGRSSASASNACYVLANEKAIKKLGDGNYQRAGIKAIAPPSKKAKAAPDKKAVNKKTGKPLQRKPTHHSYDVSNIDFIMKRMRTHPKFTLKQMEDYFDVNGRTPKSVGALLTGLIAMHKVRRIGTAQYAALKGRDYAAEKARAKQRANGAAAVVVASASEEVVSNG